MLLGAIADDFTGASDLANTLARGGMHTVQFVGVPSGSPSAGCEAGVVALKSRSIAAEAAVSQSLHALKWLQAAGCRQIIFKYCSTFDSTRQGNIGPVAEALAERLGEKGVIVCPAFPATGRTIYQGHLFVGDRLLSESGMENHPLNPMCDPDIRRWLGYQTRGEVGAVPLSIVHAGADAVRRALREEGKAGKILAVVDAVEDGDLITLAEAAAEARLITGGSGVALGLPQNYRRAGLLSGHPTIFRGTAGPGAILAGSCSRATLAQVKRYAANHPHLLLEIGQVMDGRQDASMVERFIQQHRGESPLISSSATGPAVEAAQKRFGRDASAEAIEGLFADVARRIVDGGIRRLVVAGGETSSAVVTALGLEELAIGPEIDPGVPALAAKDGALALALKSGNFGSEDFFARALAALEVDGSAPT